MLQPLFKFTAVLALIGLLYATMYSAAFIRVEGDRMYDGPKPYYFVGTNYWYGSLLGLENDKGRGIDRLRDELDTLKKYGITNLRLMAGAEGSGDLNGIFRVGPSLQPEQGKFDESVLEGLDVVLDEMRKRDMRAVIFFSNNWEWSGGFQQYLIWNRVVPEKWLKNKPNWDELRDIVSQFYSCSPCKAGYARQMELVLSRTNKLTRKRYIDDPTIMAWELANEPRPMRPAANEAYKTWIAETAAAIKRRAPKQLVTIGHEGWIGTDSVALFEEIHTDANVDYVTIHIWPKNWGWLPGGKLAEGYQNAIEKTTQYINDNGRAAEKLKKPMVIEEFGLPRDGLSFDPASSTKFRDDYFRTVLSYVREKPYIAGANFWAFGGRARPVKGQLFWKAGDEYMGDPPMEEQGLYTVFDSDISTLEVVRKKARSF